MAAQLTTHVLDAAQGRPAGGVVIELWWLGTAGHDRYLLKTAITNAGGRTDQPLLSGEDFRAGVYELVFLVGQYFRAQSNVAEMPPFLDRIPVRFGVADPTSHYHVPLLVSLGAYTTYRGS